jgi:hypothetical protein
MRDDQVYCLTAEDLGLKEPGQHCVKLPPGTGLLSY